MRRHEGGYACHCSVVLFDYVCQRHAVPVPECLTTKGALFVTALFTYASGIRAPVFESLVHENLELCQREGKREREIRVYV
jgi:hypothetical protein